MESLLDGPGAFNSRRPAIIDAVALDSVHRPRYPPEP